MYKFLLSVITVLSLTVTIAQPTAGLVAYWPMDGNFNDLGPYGIHGTNSGATATSNSAGVANKAMNFLNPGSPVVQFGTHPINSNLSFGAAQDFTITFRVYANSPVVHPGGFYDNNLNAAGPGVWFWNANGYPQIQFNFKNSSVGTTNGALPLGVWKSICCMRQGTLIKIYINGILNSSGTVGTQTPAYPIGARFGTMSFSGYSPPEYNGFNGKLDEMRIYNRALTQVEILLVLPIMINSFTATRAGAGSLLQWQTAYEQNFDHFIVQRSLDGLNFSDIGTVQAIGNPTTATNYQFNDNNLPTSGLARNVFYRLQAVDINDRMETSSIVSVSLNSSQKELMVMENPVGDDLRLQFFSSSKESAHIMIADASGRQLLTKPVELNPGTISTSIRVNTLPPGTYYVSVVTSEGRQTKAFIKK